LAELKTYKEVSFVAAIIYQLTSARTVKAVIVLTFTIIIGYLAVLNRDIPDVIALGWSAILGYYFREAEAQVDLDNNGLIDEE